MGKLIDLTGQRFGRLVVLARAENKGSKVQWLCKCDCGGSIIVRGCQLKNGGTRSCGCLHRENTEMLNRRKLSQTDGRSKTRIYRVWIGMRNRCNNPNNYDYKNYGGRGIKVCKEWEMSFDSFRIWANSHGYQENLTIDRIDVNGNYCPENCRWVSLAVQHRNQRVSRMLSCYGERKTVADWSKITGISHSTLLARIRSGWADKEILTTPVQKRQKHNK